MSSPKELFFIIYANNNEFGGKHEDKFLGRIELDCLDWNF
jgi:hypothetical protein